MSLRRRVGCSTRYVPALEGQFKRKLRQARRAGVRGRAAENGRRRRVRVTKAVLKNSPRNCTLIRSRSLELLNNGIFPVVAARAADDERHRSLTK
jgi:hypothetical protein